MTDGKETVAIAHPFPSPECPCGAPQEDPDRLYCDDCVDSMARKMAEELEAQHAE